MGSSAGEWLGRASRLAAALALLTGLWQIPRIALAQEDVDPSRYDGLFGAVPPDPALAEALPRATLKRGYQPVAVDFSALMPPPVQQELGSCVAFAFGYAARGYYAALQLGRSPGDPLSTPSPAYLHSQIAGWNPNQPAKPSVDQCRTSGSSAILALIYMAENGAPNNAAVPISDICKPEVTAMSIGKNEFSIQDGEVIFFPKDGAVAGDREINLMKQALAQGHPVVFGMNMVRLVPGKDAAALQGYQKGDIYRGSLGNHHGKLDMGHEMVMVGYDDSQQAFLVQNSWGKDWGDNGFAWISYDAVKADLNEAVLLDAGVTPPRPQPTRPKRQQPNIAKEGQCALIYEASGAGGGLRGFVETEEELEELRAGYGADAVKDVAVRPWPVCEALLTLDDPSLATSRPRITVDGGRETLAFGDVLGFSVTTPDFPSFLYVVYIQADGTVVNLVPRRGPIREQLAPGTTVRFGDGQEGRQTFRVSAPAGPEAVVAIATRSPMAQLEALETEGNGQFRLAAALRESGGEDENAQDRLYLSLLRAAIADTPVPDMVAREITADVVHVTITEN